MKSESTIAIHERIRTICLVVLASLALCYILHITSDILIPFVVALFMCYMFSPLVNALEKRNVAKWLIIILIFVILGLVVLGAAELFYSSVSAFMEKSDLYSAKAEKLAVNIGNKLGYGDEKVKNSFDMIRRDYKDIVKAKSVQSAIGSGLSSFFGFAGSMLTTFLFMGFMLAGQKTLSERAGKFIAASMPGNEDGKDIIKRINSGIRKFLYLKIIISLVTACAIGIVLTIFGVDFAWLWAVLVFLLNFIPAIGPIFSSIPPIMVSFLMLESTVAAVVVSVLVILIQFISGNIIEPKMFGKTLNLNAIVIIVSLMFWGLIWGIPGMLLSLPMTAALNIIFREIPYFKSVSILLSEYDDPKKIPDQC